MKTRVITGAFIFVFYVAVLLLSMYVHPIFFDVFVFLLALFGTYEMTRAVSNAFSPPIFVIDLIATVLSFGAFWFGHYYFGSNSSGLSAFFVVLVLMIIVTMIVTAVSKTYVKGNAVSTVLVMMYPLTLLMFSAGLNAFASPYRNAGICLMFVVPAFTDVAAYLVGSTVRGPKLCPKISPNKTISGAIGGLVGGILGAGLVLLFTYIADANYINLLGLQMLTDHWWSTIVNLIMLGLFGSLFDQLGDLFASFIKRRSGIKDFSHILPGHGGILDRVDGMMFCGVFFYMYFAVMILV
ncbi:MAG: phosphatidate cytidylyltransferase [Clostridiales bacterium]|nr:phosphatidate cytidylyltransferase [Clostridiales bacterium]